MAEINNADIERAQAQLYAMAKQAAVQANAPAGATVTAKAGGDQMDIVVS